MGIGDALGHDRSYGRRIQHAVDTPQGSACCPFGTNPRANKSLGGEGLQPLLLFNALRYWSPTIPVVNRRGSMRTNALVKRLAAPGTYRYFRSRSAVIPSRAAKVVGISHLRSGVKLSPSVISLTTPPGVKAVIETLRPL